MGASLKMFKVWYAGREDDAITMGEMVDSSRIWPLRCLGSDRVNINDEPAGFTGILCMCPIDSPTHTKAVVVSVCDTVITSREATANDWEQFYLSQAGAS